MANFKVGDHVESPAGNVYKITLVQPFLNRYDWDVFKVSDPFSINKIGWGQISMVDGWNLYNPLWATAKAAVPSNSPPPIPAAAHNATNPTPIMAKFTRGDVICLSNETDKYEVLSVDEFNRIYELLNLEISSRYFARTSSRDMNYVDKYFIKFTKPPTKLMKCQCGMEKHYQEVHRTKCPSHIHSDWCEYFKEKK
jgi:hypothetical protein